VYIGGENGGAGNRNMRGIRGYGVLRPVTLCVTTSYKHPVLTHPEYLHPVYFGYFGYYRGDTARYSRKLMLCGVYNMYNVTVFYDRIQIMQKYLYNVKIICIMLVRYIIFILSLRDTATNNREDRMIVYAPKEYNRGERCLLVEYVAPNFDLLINFGGPFCDNYICVGY
jgi:hypothetical protein